MNNLLDNELIHRYIAECAQFKNDCNYRKTLAQEIGLNENDYYILRPIIGEQEFQYILSNIKEENFMPGIRHDYTLMDSHDQTYLNVGKFKANLHIHTKYSDGIMPINEVLSQAVELANKNIKLMRTDMPLIIAVTDHDTLDGAREILTKISQNPAIYENVRIVLGIELSTITNKFKKLKKSLLIHTHMFCINPFDKNFSDYILDKKELKKLLATETINKLNNILKKDLNTLNTEFNLKEAAQLHPMLLMGQDEVCLPMKKYTASKILFSHFVLNNKKLIQLLKEKNIYIENLRPERPIVGYKELYTRNLPYSINYLDGLKLYLSKFIKNKDLTPFFDTNTISIEKILNKAFEICENAHPTLEKMPQAFFSFEETLEKLTTQKYGVFGIAHPARTLVKDTNSTPEELFDEMFNTFKKYGKNKAQYYEGYYQSYFGTTYMNYLEAIEKSAQKYNLTKTGGLDSHGPNIITRHPFI